MKRIFVLLLALMFAALPAMADSAPTGLPFTTDVAEDGSLFYALGGGRSADECRAAMTQISPIRYAEPGRDFDR